MEDMSESNHGENKENRTDIKTEQAPFKLQNNHEFAKMNDLLEFKHENEEICIKTIKEENVIKEKVPFELQNDYEYKKYTLRNRTKKTEQHKKVDNIVEPDLLVSCVHCNRPFNGTRALANHVRTHQIRKSLTCMLCNDQFSMNKELLEHKLEKHSKDQMFTCTECNTAYSDHCEYLTHMSSHIKSTKIQCAECGIYYHGHKSYKTHLLTHYNRGYKCEICNKIIMRKANYIVHVRQHSDKLEKECGECGKHFRNIDALQRHMQWHIGIKPYQCLYCGKGYNTAHGRKVHMYIRTGNKQFKCETCNKEFYQVTDYNRHKASHLGKTFTCDICQRKFKHKMNLRDHILMHMSKTANVQLNFPCKYCPANFPVFQRLRSHILHHHSEERRFKCDYCSVTFKEKSDLTRHYKSKTHLNNKFGADQKKLVKVI